MCKKRSGERMDQVSAKLIWPYEELWHQINTGAPARGSLGDSTITGSRAICNTKLRCTVCFFLPFPLFIYPTCHIRPGSHLTFRRKDQTSKNRSVDSDPGKYRYLVSALTNHRQFNSLHICSYWNHPLLQAKFTMNNIRRTKIGPCKGNGYHEKQNMLNAGLHQRLSILVQSWELTMAKYIKRAKGVPHTRACHM